MRSVEYIRTLVRATSNDTIIISTSGNISRELFHVGDRMGNFYMVGAMGGASSFAFGVACCTDKKVIVLDGDGSTLMRLGNLISIKAGNKSNLFNVILNNKCYGSTGGQLCVSKYIDFNSFLSTFTPNIICVDVDRETEKFPRPSISLRDNYKRLSDFLRR